MSERFTYPKRRICVWCDADLPAAVTQHSDILYVDEKHHGCKRPETWVDAMRYSMGPHPKKAQESTIKGVPMSR
jgi:hypothetical protein